MSVRPGDVISIEAPRRVEISRYLLDLVELGDIVKDKIEDMGVLKIEIGGST